MASSRTPRRFTLADLCPPKLADLRDVPGAAGYKVSRDGRIFSTLRGGLKAMAPYFARVSEAGEAREDEKGYWRVDCVLEDGRRLRVRVHVAVCTAFHGPKPFEGAVVRHLDDDRRNCAAVNLKWGTAAQNREDAEFNGRVPRSPDLAHVARPDPGSNQFRLNF